MRFSRVDLSVDGDAYGFVTSIDPSYYEDLGVDDAAHVRDQILEGLRTGTVTGTRDSEYGVRYQVEVPVTGNNGKVAAVETVWQVEEHAGTLRFLTVRSIEKDR